MSKRPRNTGIVDIKKSWLWAIGRINGVGLLKFDCKSPVDKINIAIKRITGEIRNTET